MPPNSVMWTVDPAHGAGVVAIAEKELRATLFHEFHHLVRAVTGTPGTVIERAVTEGMATAFERDFAGVNRPWGEHPPEGWEAELLGGPGRRPDPRLAIHAPGWPAMDWLPDWNGMG